MNMIGSVSIKAWLDQAVMVEARGLDLGIRRRVGLSRFEKGSRIVTALDGLETRFPNQNRGQERPLNDDERVAIMQSGIAISSDELLYD